MAKIAIIDLGTNTFNFLLANKEGEYIDILHETKVSVKLGEGCINDGFIAEAPFRRGIEALQKYRQLILEYHVEKVHAFATSAIRSASNGHEFVKKAKDEAGIDIQVISGDREAELIYHGVCQAIKLNDSPSLILDIGGGSSEFILATRNEIIWKKSFLLGIARLLEQFDPSDPIEQKEIAAVEAYMESMLDSLAEILQQYPTTTLIGSSGSFDTFAEMIAWRFHTPDLLDGLTNFHFNMKEFQLIHEQLLASTRAERLHTKGLTGMRVDMIVLSAVFVNYILKRFKISQMHLSTYSLKEGVLWTL